MILLQAAIIAQRSRRRRRRWTTQSCIAPIRKEIEVIVATAITDGTDVQNFLSRAYKYKIFPMVCAHLKIANKFKGDLIGDLMMTSQMCEYCFFCCC